MKLVAVVVAAVVDKVADEQMVDGIGSGSGCENLVESFCAYLVRLFIPETFSPCLSLSLLLSRQ